MTQHNADWPLQIFYDGACPLCSSEMRQYRARDRLNRIEFVDIAAPEFDATRYGLDPAEVQKAMHARTPDGRVFTQVAAFVKIWEAIPRRWWTILLRGFLKIPGMMALAGVFYRAFARNRYRLTGRCESGSCKLQP